MLTRRAAAEIIARNDDAGPGIFGVIKDVARFRADRFKRAAPEPADAGTSYGLVIPTPNGHTAPPGVAAWPSADDPNWGPTTFDTARPGYATVIAAPAAASQTPDEGAPVGVPAVGWPSRLSAADDEKLVVEPVDPQGLVVGEPVHSGPEGH